MEGHSVSVYMKLSYLPLSERFEGIQLREEITTFFPKSITIRVDIDPSQCTVSEFARLHAANIL